MNFQNTGMQQLPFSAEQPQSQPTQYTLDRPPFVPGGIPVPQQLSYLITNVCSMVANEVVNNMSKHAGRMFTFNQVSANGYQNTDFATLVVTVFDYLMLNLMKGSISVPEQGLQEAVSRVVSIYTCTNIAKFPQLVQMVNPQVAMEANNVLAQSAGIQNEIMQMKQRSMQNQQPYGGSNYPQYPQQYGGYPQQQQGGYYPQQQGRGYPQNNYPNQQHGGYPQNNQGGYYPQNSGYDRFSNNQPQQSNSPFQKAGQLVNQQFNQPGQQVNDQSDQSDRYSYLKKSFPQTQPQPVHQYREYGSANTQQQHGGYTPVPVAAPAPVPSVQKEFTYPCPKPLVWKGSKHQFHPPAYNTETEKLELHEELIEGKLYVIAKVVKLGVNEVEREKHTITTAQQATSSYIPEGFPTRVEAFKDAVKKMPSKESDKLKSDAVVDDKPFISNFEESIIFDVMNKKKLLPKDKNSSAFQVFCIKAKPFFATKNINDLAIRISKMKTLTDIASTLKSILNSHAEKELKDFIHELDIFLTYELNYFLNNKLNAETTVDSFIDDVGDIEDYLEKTRGESYSKAFGRYEKTFIDTYLTPIVGEEVVKDMASSLLDSDGKDYPNSSFVLYNHNMSFTILDLTYEELGVGIQKVGSSVIEFDSFPILYEFCNKLFTTSKKLSDNFTRHVIITSDNKKLDLHQSIFSPDTYLINRL